MFEFIDMLQFGRVIEFEGEKYQSIKPLQQGLHMAIKIGQNLPCQVYVIKEEIDVTASERIKRYRNESQL